MKEAIADGRKQIIEQMTHIRKLMDVLIVLAENDPENWGHIHNTEKVSAKLSDVERILSGYEEYIK